MSKTPQGKASKGKTPQDKYPPGKASKGKTPQDKTLQGQASGSIIPVCKAAVTIAMLLLLTSCQKVITNCNECYTTEASGTELRIILYNNPLQPPSDPVLTIYDGNISDSLILYRQIIAHGYSDLYYPALLWKEYSATLSFNLDGQEYTTVAYACPQLRYDETSCEQPCYFIYHNVLDLRLRFY